MDTKPLTRMDVLVKIHDETLDKLVRNEIDHELLVRLTITNKDSGQDFIKLDQAKRTAAKLIEELKAVLDITKRKMLEESPIKKN